TLEDRKDRAYVVARGRALLLVLFFFSSRRRHTRWPRDWSSDVCSSDLMGSRPPALAAALPLPLRRSRRLWHGIAEGRRRLGGCRSEERRVGKECRARWSSDLFKGEQVESGGGRSVGRGRCSAV